MTLFHVAVCDSLVTLYVSSNGIHNFLCCCYFSYIAMYALSVVACKFIYVCSYIFLLFVATSLDSLRELVAETAIMKNFDHPNVLQLLGVCVDINNDDGSMLKVILPFMSNGDLRSFLKKNRVEPNDIRHFPKVNKFI